MGPGNSSAGNLGSHPNMTPCLGLWGSSERNFVNLFRQLAEKLQVSPEALKRTQARWQTKSEKTYKALIVYSAEVSLELELDHVTGSESV